MPAMQRTTWTAGVLLLVAAIPHPARADEEPTARVREMLRRTQEALRQAQSENAELTRAKTEIEEKLKAAGTQLDAQQSGSKAAQGALNAKLAAAKGAQDDLTHKLADASERLAAAGAKLNEVAKELAARDADLAAAKHGIELGNAANASCESKNLKLYSYSQELLQAYRTKGVWAALSQKDPVLGLKEVDVENVVQEYRLKFASEKVKQ
jgi:chromosome segregation ATPase